jgi:hypothetical protein
MYTSFEITNFRCFDHLKLDDLARVNLIAGKNNVGKTALLEALYLHCKAYDPEISLRLESSRGIRLDFNQLSGTVWDALFYRMDNSQDIELRGTEPKSGWRSLRLQVVRRPEEMGKLGFELLEKDLSTGESVITATAPATQIVLLKYEDEAGRSGKVHLSVDTRGEGRFTPMPPSPPFPTSFILSQGRSSSKENAERFKNLVVNGKREQFLETLRLLEPRLRSLELLPMAGETIIHGEIGAGRPMPLNYMGEGLNRLANMVMAIGDNENGVVLIDEIENGLHYSVMKDVWKAIGQAAREFNTQIFATTHSWECLVAAHRAFTETNCYDDFKLHRLERRKTGEIRTVTYDQETLEGSIEMGFEVR